MVDPPADRALDVFADLRRRVADVLRGLIARGMLPPSLDLARFSVAPAPATSGHDAAVDAALVYAGPAAAHGLAPGDLARLLADEIAREPPVARAEAVARGFVDVTWQPEASGAALAALLAAPRPGPPARRGWDGNPSLAEARAGAVADALAALGADAQGAGRAGAPVGPVSVARAAGGRPGTAFDLREAEAACGRDALRFALAAADPAAPLALDLDALGERWRGNPAFWVPYAHARGRAALRRAARRRPGLDLSPEALAGAALARLDGAGDRDLVRAVLATPWVVSRCAGAGSARRLASHLAGLADKLHAQSRRSTDQPQSRFVNEERGDSSGARLGLMAASVLVLGSGLGILGLTAPDEVP